MPYDVGYVKLRFPEHAKAIDELASRSESFRDLCFDFESAETIMRKWKASDAPDAQKRYNELSLLADELAQEIVVLLDGASVIPFGKPTPKR
ncbi:hypothetical protein [Rhizobium tubonense]|uniref:Uncharacterized protein n=1 Tax=Rhizobium tubonense TaxID=484088 RepID=A0A2W4EUE3_9HYPH|nr:hypothetical protein [Rhizobium tubonense]PZM14413.1 hypothetical protein CPY51_11445 [Rhizobium tubonense]